MFSRLEFFIAFRYLKARRSENFLSVISIFSFFGIMLGVGTLIVVLAVRDGFRDELLDRILGVNGHILVYSLDGTIMNYDSITSKIKNIDGIKSVYPVIDEQVMAISKNKVTGTLVRGIKYSDLYNHEMISENIITGSIKNNHDKNSVIIGSQLSRILEVKVGDKIKLLSPIGTPTAFGNVPRISIYTVSAIFNVGMYEYDSTYLFIPLKSSQNFFQYNSSVQKIEIRLKNPELISLYRKLIFENLDGKVHIIDWKQLNKTVVDTLNVERNVMFLILTLIIIVAAFNIVSGLVMLVNEKSRDIAILRTIGASRLFVMKIFLLAGSFVGILGTICGALLGVAFASNIESIQKGLEKVTGELFPAEIYYLTNLPAKIIWSDVAEVVAMSVILSLLATLYPSWKATRYDPVEALRYE